MVVNRRQQAARLEHATMMVQPALTDYQPFSAYDLHSSAIMLGSSSSLERMHICSSPVSGSNITILES